jgi:hypothetical protein
MKGRTTKEEYKIKRETEMKEERKKKIPLSASKSSVVSGWLVLVSEGEVPPLETTVEGSDWPPELLHSM